MGKTKFSSAAGISDLAAIAKGERDNISVAPNDNVNEKNVSLQVKESIRTRLRKLHADKDITIQKFVEDSLDKSLTKHGY